MTRSHTVRRAWRAISFTLAVTLCVALHALLLGGCPVNDLHVYLARATGFNGELHVSITTGDDANPGTAEAPLKTIQTGIELGKWYLDQGLATSVDVKVAAGTYPQESVSGVYVEMVEGVSLFGGFPVDFSEYDPEAHITIIEDTSSGGEVEYIAAVQIGAEVTEATQLNGFTIVGGSCDVGYMQAVRVDNGSPDIGFNVIHAGGSNSALATFGASNPIIRNNTIVGSAGDHAWKGALIVVEDSNPIVEHNTIIGEGNDTSGDQCYAVFIADTTVQAFSGNTVNGGVAAQSSAIFVDTAEVHMSENTITGGIATAPGEYAVGVNAGGDSEVHFHNNEVTAQKAVFVEGPGSIIYAGGNTISSVSEIPEAVGMELMSGANCEIYDNAVTAEGIGVAAMGIRILSPPDSSHIYIADNTVTAVVTNHDDESDQAVGIQVEDIARAEVRHNEIAAGPAYGGQAIRIFGGSGFADIIGNTVAVHGMEHFATGILYHDCNGRIESNVINPGLVSATDSSSEGIVLRDTVGVADDGVWLLNNTVYGGGGDGGSFPIYVERTTAYVENNIIFAGAAGGNGIGLEGTDAEIGSLRNNLFYRPYPGMTLYVDINDPGNGGDDETYDDIATLEAELNASFDNLDSNDVGGPEFVNQNGDDENIDTMSDNDWHLGPSTPPGIYEGGYVVPDFSTEDRDGVPRTDPWSIGAYEYDGP